MARRDDIKSTPAAVQKYSSGGTTHAVEETDVRCKGTLPVQTEADVKTAHRKARFVTAPIEYQLKPPSALENRSSPAARNISAVPGSHSSSLAPTPRYTEKSYDDDISVTYTEPQSYANRTNAEFDHSSSHHQSIRETRAEEEGAALARDRQLQDLPQHKLRERKSFFGSFQKLQRRDISDRRHTVGITYDNSLPPFNYADDSSIAHLPPDDDPAPTAVYPDCVATKTRKFSGSMKSQFKKFLRVASRAPSGLVPQRPEPVPLSYTTIEQERQEILQCSTVLSDPFVVRDSPAALGQTIVPPFQQGIVECNVSINGDAATDRSRVTSWANSTAAGTTSTFANTASMCAADEHGRLQRSDSQPRLRKKSSFFGRAVQNRLRKTSRADLKGSYDSQALFMALRERILPQDVDEEKKDRSESATSTASRTSSSLSMLPSRKRAESITPSAHRGASTIRTVSPDPDAYKMMSPVVEVSPDRVLANDEFADQTPTANHYASKRRAAPLQAEPPSSERIARRVQQSQARWQAALRTAPVAPEAKIASAYDEDNPYELPSLSRHPYQDADADTGGLPRHAKISAPTFVSRARELLSPSVYSRATDGASPCPTTPEEGGMTVKITSREVKRYALSPPRKQENYADRPVQASGEWRRWLSEELNSLTDTDTAGSLTHEPLPAPPMRPLGPFSRDQSATTGSGSQKYGSDSERASRTRQGSRPRTSSRRSSYMNERYPIIDSSGNSSRRTSRKYSVASNHATDAESSLQRPGSDDSKQSPELINSPSSKTSAIKSLPKRHSLAHLDSSSQTKALPTSTTATKPSTSANLTMSGAIPDKESNLSTTHLRPPSALHHKHHQSAHDLRAKYKTNSTSTSRPIEVRRKKSTPVVVAVFEDPTIQNISAGPYAASATASLNTNNASAHASTNKENTPAANKHHQHVDDGSGGLPALSSSEWLAGPTSKKAVARPRSSPPKAVGLGENGIGNGNGREGSSPGQRLVPGWIQGRKGRGGGVGGVGGGEGAFL